MKRRDFLARCVTPALLATNTEPVMATTQQEVRHISFLLKETAGLRRFGYPVHVKLPMDFASAGLDDDGFTLKRDGRTVAAQFRRVTQSDGSSLVALDFNASPGPFEVQNYTVHYNAGLKTPEVKGRGMEVRRIGSTIEVSHSPFIRYAIPDDLTGFLRSVKIPGAEFVSPDSPGLFVVAKGRQTGLVSLDPKSSPERWCVSVARGHWLSGYNPVARSASMAQSLFRLNSI